jgi:Lon protease-like protein
VTGRHLDAFPLFPLSLVLLPQEIVPLHIFEERYKELIAACLEGEQEFGLMLFDPEGLRTVGTRASVEAVLERFDDGRMNIVVRGGQRFAIEAFTEGRSFETAHVGAYEDDPGGEGPSDEERARCLDAFNRLAAAADARAGEPDPAAESLAFHLAGRIAFPADSKQELLELRSERARVRRVIELMAAAEEALHRRSAIRERVSGNGHVEAP